VLDRYPPKAPDAPRSPVVVTSRPGRGGAAPPVPSVPAPATSTPPGGAGGTPAEGLIRLEKPFDVDEFSQMLGETAIRLTVPHDALAEVLRRTTDFMGFGIYVYSITVRPSDSELLKGFVVELQRVDYDPETGAWKPFVEKGAAGAPGEPTSTDGP